MIEKMEYQVLSISQLLLLTREGKKTVLVLIVD
jgi:hypothetical protein